MARCSVVLVIPLCQCLCKTILLDAIVFKGVSCTSVGVNALFGTIGICMENCFPMKKYNFSLTKVYAHFLFIFIHFLENLKFCTHIFYSFPSIFGEPPYP